MVSFMLHSQKKHSQRKGSNDKIIYRIIVLLVLLGLVGAGFLYIFMKNRSSEHSHSEKEFQRVLKEICANPRLPVPEYKGVQSFFTYLTKPDLDHCYSWLEFGGEKIIIPGQTERECLDEVRKNKFICFNEEYEMNLDPCLVYSFVKDADQQFERDMHMFSCEVHVFDAFQVKEGENLRRTEFWFEHAWDISEYPYDIPPEEHKKTQQISGNLRRRSLDYIAHVLKHEGRTIKFLKSDLEGREWILLKQIITHHDLIDIRQIALRLHLPVTAGSLTGTARHQYFEELFQVLQGLTCLGFKNVMVRPIKYYKTALKVPEVNGTFYPAYEVNFAKVIKKR